MCQLHQIQKVFHRVPIASPVKSATSFTQCNISGILAIYTFGNSNRLYTYNSHYYINLLQVQVLSIGFQFSLPCRWTGLSSGLNIGATFPNFLFSRLPPLRPTLGTFFPAPLIPEELNSILVWGPASTTHLRLKGIPTSCR